MALRRRGDQARATSSPTPRSATPWSSTPRSAARPTCCCTCRPSPTPPACDGRRSTTGPKSTVRVPRLVDALPNGPVGHPDGPRVSGRRRAGSDAPPARAGLARSRRAHRGRRHARRGARLVGEAPSAAQRLRELLRRRDGVDPDDVIMSPERAARARADAARSAFRAATWRPKARSSRARPSTRAWSTPTACIARPARPACSRARRDADRRDQGTDASDRSSPAT